MMGSCAIASAKAFKWRIAIQLLSVNEARKNTTKGLEGRCGEGVEPSLSHQDEL